MKKDSHNSTDLALNLGAGINYQLTPKIYANAEGSFMFGDNECAIILIVCGNEY